MASPLVARVPSRLFAASVMVCLPAVSSTLVSVWSQTTHL